MRSLEMERDLQAFEHLSNVRKGMMCAICNDFLRDPYNLPCGHTFCKSCIDAVIAHKNLCPECKEPAWQKDIFKVALAESAASEWVKQCEVRYQELARQLADEEDKEETNSMCSDALGRSHEEMPVDSVPALETTRARGLALPEGKHTHVSTAESNASHPCEGLIGRKRQDGASSKRGTTAVADQDASVTSAMTCLTEEKENMLAARHPRASVAPEKRLPPEQSGKGCTDGQSALASGREVGDDEHDSDLPHGLDQVRPTSALPLTVVRPAALEAPAAHAQIVRARGWSEGVSRQGKECPSPEPHESGWIGHEFRKDALPTAPRTSKTEPKRAVPSMLGSPKEDVVMAMPPRRTEDRRKWKCLLERSDVSVAQLAESPPESPMEPGKIAIRTPPTLKPSQAATSTGDLFESPSGGTRQREPLVHIGGNMVSGLSKQAGHIGAFSKRARVSHHDGNRTFNKAQGVLSVDSSAVHRGFERFVTSHLDPTSSESNRHLCRDAGPPRVSAGGSDREWFRDEHEAAPRPKVDDLGSAEDRVDLGRAPDSENRGVPAAHDLVDRNAHDTSREAGAPLSPHADDDEVSDSDSVPLWGEDNERRCKGRKAMTPGAPGTSNHVASPEDGDVKPDVQLSAGEPRGREVAVKGDDDDDTCDELECRNGASRDESYPGHITSSAGALSVNVAVLDEQEIRPCDASDQETMADNMKHPTGDAQLLGDERVRRSESASPSLEPSSQTTQEYPYPKAQANKDGGVPGERQCSEGGDGAVRLIPSRSHKNGSQGKMKTNTDGDLSKVRDSEVEVHLATKTSISGGAIAGCRKVTNDPASPRARDVGSQLDDVVTPATQSHHRCKALEREDHPTPVTACATDAQKDRRPDTPARASVSNNVAQEEITASERLAGQIGDFTGADPASTNTPASCVSYQESEDGENSTDDTEGRLRGPHARRMAAYVPETAVESISTQEVAETLAQDSCAEEKLQTFTTRRDTAAHEDDLQQRIHAETEVSETLPQPRESDGSTLMAKKARTCHAEETPDITRLSATSYLHEPGTSLLVGALDSSAFLMQDDMDEGRSSGAVKAEASESTNDSSVRKRPPESATLSPERPSSCATDISKRQKMTASSSATSPGLVKRAPSCYSISSSCSSGAESTSEETTRTSSDKCPPRTLASELDPGQVGHDPAAAQDVWRETNDYDQGRDCGASGGDDDCKSDEDSKAPLTCTVGEGRLSSEVKPVSNPYAPDVHLELEPDDDSPTASSIAPWVSRDKSNLLNSPIARSSPRKQRTNLPRPSIAKMGFGGPSSVIARSSGLLPGAVDDRIREKNIQRCSNRILAAGRDENCSEGDPLTRKGSSWSTYSMGPNTEEVEELEAGLAARRSKRGSSPIGPRSNGVSNAGRSDEIELDDAEASTGSAAGVRLREPNESEDKLHCSQEKEVDLVTPSRTRRALSKPRSKGLMTVGRQRKPIIAALGFEDWEMERAKSLCKVLGQHHLHTQLVWGVTHVVVGSQYTVQAKSKRGGRHLLVKHMLEGYHEAVLHGLWILDFDWVEACLGRGPDDDGRVVETLWAPPRDFELAGCREQHAGCDPRRGRVAKGLKRPGVLHGVQLCVLGKREVGTEKARIERVAKMAGASLLDSTSRSHGRQDGWRDDPFDDDDDFVDAAATARSKKSVVVVAVADLADGHISGELARAATAKGDALAANGVVHHSWVLRSIEQASLRPYDRHPVSRATSRLPNAAGGRESRTSTNSRSARGRLSIPLGSEQREVLLDVDNEGGRRPGTVALSGKDEEKPIIEEAQKVVDSKARVVTAAAGVQAMGLGAAGFSGFSRIGSTRKHTEPKSGVDGQAAGTYISYQSHLEAHKAICVALHEAGYLNMGNADEAAMGDFWCDQVYHGILNRRSEAAGKRAKERGCPLRIIRAEYEHRKDLQSDDAKRRLANLPKEFSLWEERDRNLCSGTADDAVDLLEACQD